MQDVHQDQATTPATVDNVPKGTRFGGHIPEYLIGEPSSSAKQPVTLMGGFGLLLLIFLLTRLIAWSGAYTGVLLKGRLIFGLTPPLVHHSDRIEEASDPNTQLGRFFADHYLNFAPLTGWDGAHYRDITTNGYLYKPNATVGTGYNIAFFPLYPMLVWPVNQWLGNVNLSLVLVAHLVTLIAVGFLYWWIRGLAGHSAALTACGCLLTYPSACYLALAYAECVMLLFIVLTCIALYRGNYWLAAILCGIGTASRPTAVVVAPVVLLHWLIFGRGELRAKLIKSIPLGLLSITGALSYAGYLTYRFGSPFVYSDNFRTGWVHTEARSDWVQFLTGARVWDQTFKYAWRMLKKFPDESAWIFHANAWNMPVTWFIIFLSIGGMWRVPAKFRPLLLIGPLIFLQSYLASGGADFGVMPIGRYMAMAAPAFVVLGAWMVREWTAGARAAVFSIFAVLQFSWAFHFGLGEWPG
jgi:hypothetical protein